MLKSYWKTAIRFLLKNKTFSLINVIGLAMGTVCCIYILLYVHAQHSYDRHEAHAAPLGGAQRPVGKAAKVDERWQYVPG